MIRERYGNLFDMYERITGEDPYKVPMRIYPAIHYTMGGLWVDYNLMSNIPGLFVLGEANFSDHGANRLGASALMQGLADGYFVDPVHPRQLPRSEQAGAGQRPRTRRSRAPRPPCTERTSQLLAIKGKRTVDEFHRELGQIMWEHCGMARNDEGLNKLLDQIPALREEFWRDVNVTGGGRELNQSLEKAGRVADFLELGELLATDALHRRSPAAATSARSARPPTARPCATTSTSPTSPPGNGAATRTATHR